MADFNPKVTRRGFLKTSFARGGAASSFRVAVIAFTKSTAVGFNAWKVANLPVLTK